MKGRKGWWVGGGGEERRKRGRVKGCKGRRDGWRKGGKQGVRPQAETVQLPRVASLNE